MSTTTERPAALTGRQPADYRSHPLHSTGRTFPETNCYVDIIIELLHARGDEPLAAMGTTMRTDFEGDQWTFLKPAPEDLELLYGVDIHEMQPYAFLPEQIAGQIAQARTVIVELDACYLPDTVSTSYHTEHVKTSVAVEAVDPAAQRLRYFHNRGLHELEGEDFRGVFRLGRPFSADVLPPYTELVRFDAGPRLSGAQLRSAARMRLRHHLDRRPHTNPFARFRTRLEQDLPRLLEGDAAEYHAYAFATVRMVGAAFEVGASHVDWVLGEEAAPARQALLRIVEGSKILLLKLARRRAFEPQAGLVRMEDAWEEAVTTLDDVLG